MIMIAWKVMGKDIVRIILGLIFITAVTIIIYKSMRKTCFGFNRKVKGNGLRFWEASEYEWIDGTYKDNNDINIGAMWFLHMVILITSTGFTYLIMFD